MPADAIAPESSTAARKTIDAIEGQDARMLSVSTHKFIRDIAFSNIPVPFQKLQTYLWLLILTRALGAREFGAWSLFVITLSTALTLSTMNCGSSLMRFASNELTDHEVNQAFSTVVIMVATSAVALGLIFILFSKQFARGIFGAAHWSVLVILLAAGVTFDSLFEEMKNILRARRLNESWAYFCLARVLPETIAVIAAGMFTRNANSAATAYVCVSLCSVASGFLYLRIRFTIVLVKPAMRLFSKYVRYGLPLLPGVFASTLSLGADRYVISRFLGLRQVGIYGVCFAVSAVVFFLTGPINNVLFPELAALYDGGQWAGFLQRFRAVQKFVFAFAFCTASILVAFPRQVLALVAPPEFAAGDKTLAVLGFQGIFMAFVLLYVVVLNTRLRVWSTTLFWLVSGAAIILMDMFMVPRIGILGAALSQLIATAAGALVLIGSHWQLFARTFDLTWLFKAALGFASVCILAFAVKRGVVGITADIVAITAGSLSFVACLLVTRYFTFKDIGNFAAAFF